MKFTNKLLIIILFSPLYLISQTKDQYDFIGTLILEDKSLITYRIQFNIEKNLLSGFSYTDMQGKNETKSKINGIYNERDKVITFKESDILYTKSKELSDIFCFVNVEGKLQLKKNKNKIEGSFIGLYNSKDTCATGEVILISLKDAFKKFENLSNTANKLKKIDSIKKEKLNPDNIISKFNPNILKKDEVLSVFWKSNKFIIEIWDNGKEDGDKITLTHNKKTVFRNYEVKKAKKRIEINLKEGENILEISANNNGMISPNTARVILIDGETTHLISTHLEAGKSSKINIVYKPK